LEQAIETMARSLEWTADAFENPMKIKNTISANETIAFKWVHEVLLMRWIIFRTFVEVAKEQNAGKLPPDIKHDWLLFQILPVFLVSDRHPFLAFMNSCLFGMSLEDLENQLSNFSPKGILGSAFNSECDKFFYVLDEAQVAGNTHMGAFADADGLTPRPVLRPIIRAWNTASLESIRFIVSGTGFSLNLFPTVFQMVLTSGVGKATGSALWQEVHQTGDFINRGVQESYVSRYLPPTFLSSPSGTALVSRLFEWLRGW
jgi:hypothetical protein